MNLYGAFILGVNIKCIVFTILYRHIKVPMAFKELSKSMVGREFYCKPSLAAIRTHISSYTFLFWAYLVTETETLALIHLISMVQRSQGYNVPMWSLPILV